MSERKIYRYEFLGLDGAVIQAEDSSFGQTPKELHLTAQVGLRNINARSIATSYIVRDLDSGEIVVRSEDWRDVE